MICIYQGKWNKNKIASNHSVVVCIYSYMRSLGRQIYYSFMQTKQPKLTDIKIDVELFFLLSPRSSVALQVSGARNLNIYHCAFGNMHAHIYAVDV